MPAPQSRPPPSDMDEPTERGTVLQLPETLESKLISAMIADHVADRVAQREDMAGLRSAINRNGAVQGVSATMQFVIALVALYGFFAFRGVDIEKLASAVTATAPLASPTVTTTTTTETTPGGE